MIPYKGTYKVTQPYKGILHKGIDLVGVTTKNISAPVSGKVIEARYDTFIGGGMGLYVKILGIDLKYHLLGHMSKINVKPNSFIVEGGIIGVEGNTGNSFGSHCHYEVRETTASSSFIDVSKYMNIPNQIGTYESEVKMTFTAALEILVKTGIVSSPDYWIKCEQTTKHIEELILNMAKAMVK